MFERLTFKWAGTLFACLAVLLIPIPYVSPTAHSQDIVDELDLIDPVLLGLCYSQTK